MPTPSEKRALVFLSAMLSLGAGVRATKALSAEPPPPSAAARADLHRQIVAVDSADSVERSGGGKRHRSKRPVARGVSTSNGSDASISADSTAKSRKRKKGTKLLPQSAEQAHDIGVSSAGPIDLDRAQEWEILALPKVGPTLAHRILANRDSLGPFGSLDELRRVKGVGEAVVDAITPYVTFSQQPRQSREKEGDGVSAGRREKRRKRQSPSQ